MRNQVIKYILNIFVLGTCFYYRSIAQNLVLNPSFENYYSCPSNVGMMDSCKNWYSDGISSPDYFNPCATSQYVNVPLNKFGYQVPRTGLSYAGFGPYSYSSVNNIQNNYREFIQTKLIDTLDAGKTYCIKFYLSLSDSVIYASSKISTLFTSNKINLFDSNWPYYYLGGFSPQASNPLGNFYTNTSGWQLFEYSFSAVGTEQYLTIGNFLDNQIDTLRVRSGDHPYWSYWASSYYYIDDVSVEEIKPVNAGTDKSIVTGDSIIIGLNIDSAGVYAWWPHVGISDTTILNPWVQPTQTTTYFVTKTQCSVATTDTVVVVVSPVGIKENYFSTKINLQPNPNNGNFTIEYSKLPKDCYLEIYELSGKFVYNQTLMNTASSIAVNLEKLESGLYIYKLKSLEGLLKTGKLIISK